MNTIFIETAIVLLFSALFSGMEIAFVSSSKLRFEMDREEQGITARIIDIFYRHPNHFISTIHTASFPIVERSHLGSYLVYLL